MEIAGRRCAVCARPISQPPTGRTRRFCSGSCRQASYRSRQQQQPGGTTPDLDWSVARSKLFTGDAAEVLGGLPSGSVHCVVTSPPYFGLRDYQGQRRQIGLEPTVGEYVKRLTDIFEQVRRVLRPDGTLWLNLGDSYSGRANSAAATRQSGRADRAEIIPARVNTTQLAPYKSLLGVPWRVATALTDQRWVLRNEIIWHKPNGLPYNGADRLANRHEHLFLFTPTSRNYHFDLHPLRVPSTRIRPPGRAAHPDGANPGDVWMLSTNRVDTEHVAAYPVDLASRAISADCPDNGIVLDFCSGSGTTGVAALQLGRRYIGIDLHRPYNDAAAARLTDHGTTEHTG